MDRGAWWATVHGVTESDRTEHQNVVLTTGWKAANPSERLRITQASHTNHPPATPQPLQLCVCVYVCVHNQHSVPMD